MTPNRIMGFKVLDREAYIKHGEEDDTNCPVCIIGGKGTGKTERLIELAAKDFCYIVVRSESVARQIAERAKKKGIDIPFPLTYIQFIRGNFYGRGIRCFVIDDVDALLWYLARGVRVKAFSLDASSVKLLYKRFDPKDDY